VSCLIDKERDNLHSIAVEIKIQEKTDSLKEKQTQVLLPVMLYPFRPPVQYM
jgi:hypothetical protein